jgi:hypothetical protein
VAKFTVESPVQIIRQSPKHTIFQCGDNSVHFFAANPVAVVNGGMVYHLASTAPISRMVNEIMPDAPHVRASVEEFNFVLGQALSRSGLSLTWSPKQ